MINKKKQKGTLDSIGMNACVKSNIDWFRGYRKFWEQVKKDAKQVKR